MEHEEIEEIFTPHGPCPVLAALGMHVAEGDHAILTAQDILLPDHPPVEVPAKIDDRLVAVAHIPAVDHPLFGAVTGHLQAAVHQGLEEFGPEYPGQGLVTEEIACRLYPPVRIGGL